MKGTHDNCSNWDYETHPEAQRVTERCEKLVRMLNGRPRIFSGYSTRRAHRYMFHGLTPNNCRYLAGNYRGSNFPCLRDYRVGVHGDRRVGTEPHNVGFQMQLFEAQLQMVIKAFAQDVYKAGKFDQKLLLAFVEILAKFLVYFFAVHPYANGNGHSGRLIVLVLLKRFNLDPKSWPLDDSPPYGDAIRAHRDGKPALLHNFILDRIFN